jgi:hypothetical protein
LRVLKYVALSGLLALSSLSHSLSLTDIKKKVYEWRWPIATAAALYVGTQLGSRLERNLGTPDWSRFTLEQDPTVTVEDGWRKTHGDIFISQGKLQLPGKFAFGHYSYDSAPDRMQSGPLIFYWAKPRAN